MWGYYGSKSKVCHHYPKPKFPNIVEPFAGTARYSLMYWDRNVLLIDKYDTICNLWKWLQSCSPKDILETRILEYGQSTDDFEWDCQERKDLVGFIITAAPTMPKKKASRWKTVVRPNTQNYKLRYIADNLYKIKHWKIACGDYSDSPEIEATWFIDPPYIVGGKYYKHSSKDIDYGDLSGWVKSRRGQVIACESTGADWLPFVPLVKSRGNRYMYEEVVYLSDNRPVLVDGDILQGVDESLVNEKELNVAR